MIGETTPPTRPVRVGIGGWTYEPWRGVFYPEGLPHKRELEHAASVLTAIEVNGTFYRTQAPETFASWAAAAPEGFVFALKAPRYVGVRKVLAEAKESIERFVGSGIQELGDKLGPINWQFAPTKRFDPDDFARFLDLLPERVGERPLRHALEVRHDSFLDARFFDLVRERGCAVVHAGSDDYPEIEPDPDAPFVYARLMRTREEIETGYAPEALDAIAARAKAWAARAETFVFFISGAKVRAPAAARALIDRL